MAPRRASRSSRRTQGLRSGRWRSALLWLLVIALLLAWAACTHRLRRAESPRHVPGRKPPWLEPYRRADWLHWVDEDRDCQDTRTEVLVAESRTPVVFARGARCKIARGLWRCPYTGMTVTDPHQLDVDHLVPLANAHRSGGNRWSAARRRAYANDLRNQDHLVAVLRSANRAKGAKAPDAWRPPERTSWCWYQRAWSGVKTRWKLSMTETERAALSDLSASCSAAQALSR